MNPATLHKEIEIAAPPAQVWHFVGTASGLGQWWGVDITMDECNRGHFTETGYQNGHSVRKVGEVITYDPPRQLSIRLHHADCDRAWPTRSEIDIHLAEEPQADGTLHTTVSVVHRSIFDEADMIGIENLMPIQPSTTDAHDPTMLLRHATAYTDKLPTVIVGRAAKFRTYTLQDRYLWRSMQEQVWHERMTTLLSLI